MKIISKYIDKTNRLLVIKETPAGNLIGEVYDDGVEMPELQVSRAIFQGNNECRVCEYFGFSLSDKVNSY